MLELKPRKQLADEAFKLAGSLNLVNYHSRIYIPADYETGETSVQPIDADRTMWMPLPRIQLQRIAAEWYGTLFGSDSELAAFEFMVLQNAMLEERPVTTLLVRTLEGLRELDERGALVEVTGHFRPNTLLPMLNEDPADKTRVFDTVAEWVGSEEDAHSLLRHLATSLAPGWSAIKYVLLLGDGRNGKSLLMTMLLSLFGRDNVSSVTRQAMSEQSPVVTELNGKLLNLIFDGPAVYLKDSGVEKSVVAGEPVSIRKLYESTATMVQTNALFVEGLNREPKTNDKSNALQRRLVRFQFPNVYDQDNRFKRLMLSPASLGALLSLLLDHYVLEDDMAGALRPTTHAIEMQLEQMYANSVGLQFLKNVEETDALGTAGLLGDPLGDLVKMFQSWRIKENDLGTWADPDVVQVFAPLVKTERKSVRVNGQVRKVRVVVSFKQEAAAFIASMKGSDDDDAALLDSLVED